MRVVKKPQLCFGEVNIVDITFNPRSHDDILAVLVALQYIYVNEKIRDKVFDLLEKILDTKVDSMICRPGWSFGKYFMRVPKCYIYVT